MKTYNYTPLQLVCPACGKLHKRCASWRYGDYCSRKCYFAMPFPRRPDIKVADLERVCRMYLTQKRAAEAIGVSYRQFRRVVHKLNLNHHFPLRYGAASWAEGRC